MIQNLKEQQRRRPAGALFTSSYVRDSVNDGIRQRGSMGNSYSGADDFSMETNDSEALDLGSMAVAQEQNTSWRLKAVRQAEASLAQLQNMFTQFAGILADQGEMLEHIDHNIDSSVLYVDQANNILTRQLAIVKRNRGLVIKILIFVVVTVIVFFIFYR